MDIEDDIVRRIEALETSGAEMKARLEALQEGQVEAREGLAELRTEKDGMQAELDLVKEQVKKLSGSRERGIVLE